MKEVSHRDDIQALRGMAVLAVILYHVNKDWLPGGFIGVDIFLVISGFLVTSIILRKQHENSFTFLSFYISRIKRIVPAYLVMLAAVSLAMAVLLIPYDFDSYKKSLVAAAYFNSNNFFANGYDYFTPAAHDQPLLHTWSLAIEMQFYLLLPAILAFIPRRFLGPALITAIGLILSYATLQIVEGYRETVYFSLLARIPEFLLGSLLALQPVEHNRHNKISNFAAVVGLLLILWSCLFITEMSAFPGLSALAPCMGAVLLIAAHQSSVNRWIAATPLAKTGDLSYSLYLWHWPILAALRYYFETYHLPVPALLSFSAITIACSYLSYRYIELPFKRGTTAASLVRIPALAAGALIAAWASYLLNPGLLNPLPPALTSYGDRAEICHDKIVGDCLRGDKTADATILMLGDSHGAQLNYFADELGNSLHSRIRVITASACVPIQGFDVERIAEHFRPTCLSQLETAKKYLESADAIIVAGAWHLHVNSPLFMNALDRFIRDATSRNQRVFVLAQIPPLASDVRRTHRFVNLGLVLPRRDNSDTENEWRLANHEIEKLVSIHRHADFLNLTHDKFFENAPFENDVLIYGNRRYLNEVGSRRYGEVASSYFTNLLGVDNHGKTLLRPPARGTGTER